MGKLSERAHAILFEDKAKETGIPASISTNQSFIKAIAREKKQMLPLGIAIKLSSGKRTFKLCTSRVRKEKERKRLSANLFKCQC
jgi:hypothetical protein